MIELRPSEARGFLAQVDEMALQVGQEVRLTGARRLPQGEPLPASYPHCGGRLSWGTGPHVTDAAAQGIRSVAW